VADHACPVAWQKAKQGSSMTHGDADELTDKHFVKSAYQLLKDRFWRKAVVSQANRKQLRWTVHSDLNRVLTAGRLWCAYAAPRVSVDCYRPIAAAGRRAGCAGS
jgi:hypothetical protein